MIQILAAVILMVIAIAMMIFYDGPLWKLSSILWAILWAIIVIMIIVMIAYTPETYTAR